MQLYASFFLATVIIPKHFGFYPQILEFIDQVLFALFKNRF
jgi:hypothetical protein